MLINILAWIIVGGVAGWLASLVMNRDGGYGIVGNVVIGIIGSFIGGYVLRFFGQSDPNAFSILGILTAALGAVILLVILGLIRKLTK